MHPHVVGRVEQFAAVGAEQHRRFFGLHVDRPHFVLLVGTGDEFALAIETQAVGTACRFHEGLHLAVDRPHHDAIVRLIGEEDVALGVCRRAFSERELARDFFQLRSRRDDGAGGEVLRRQRRDEQRGKAEYGWDQVTENEAMRHKVSFAW